MKKLVLLAVLVVSCLLLSAISVAAQDADLVIWADNNRSLALEDLIGAFAEEYGIIIDLQELELGDIRNNISIAAPAGEGPDLFVGPHDWLGELIENGVVAPLNLGDVAEKFTPTSLNLFTWDGEVYAMPYAAENVALVYNPELVPEPPTTWDEVAEITAELIDSGTAQYGFMMQDSDAYHFHPILTAYGGYVFGRDDSGNYDPSDVGFGNDGGVAAGEWVAEMAEAGYVVPGVDDDTRQSLYEQSEAALLITGPWVLPRFREAGISYAIAPLPSGPAGEGIPFVGGNGFYMSAFSENQLLAEAFLTEFVANPETMLALFEQEPRPPALIEILESIEDEDLKAFQAAGVNGIPMPNIPAMAQVWSPAGNATQFIIQGDLDAATAMTDAQTQIEEAIGMMDSLASVVSIAGNFQMALGCAGDWDPTCEDGFLNDNMDGTFSLTTTDIPAGDYEAKVTVGASWDENYGAEGVRDGENITFTVSADGAEVTFIYESETNVLTVTEGE